VSYSVINFSIFSLKSKLQVKQMGLILHLFRICLMFNVQEHAKKVDEISLHADGSNDMYERFARRGHIGEIYCRFANKHTSNDRRASFGGCLEVGSSRGGFSTVRT
jgi:hypothetical protein